MANFKNCTFKITSHVINLDENGSPDGNVENDDFTVCGLIKTESGCTTLSYEERREDAKILCEISAKKDRVEVRRRKDVACDMLFLPNATHKCIYKVPPFSFDMEIKTSRIENTIENPGGALTLFYSMIIGGAEKRCRMKITRID